MLSSLNMFNFFQKKSTENTQKVSLSLKGLHCSSCAVNIDLALEDLKGIVNSKTNYARSISIIDYDPNTVDTKKIISEILKLGYEVISQN